MATTSLLPPGYCFDPKDDDLIYYLKKKINNDPIETGDIREANVYDYDPKTLTDEKFPGGVGQDEMFNFFTPRERKYPNGSRPDRRAGNGYWKANGADIKIKVEDKVEGFKKVLVFYYGTASDPKKIKTNWIMHEYRLNQDSRRKRNAQDMRLDDWVLCRIYERGAVRNQERAQNPIVVHHQNDSAQLAAEEANSISTIAAAEPTAMTYMVDECEQSTAVDNANETNNQEMINFGNNFGTSSSDHLHLDQTYSEEAADLPLFSEEVEFLRKCCSDNNIEVEAQQPPPALIHQPVDWNDPIYIEDDNDLEIADQYGTDIEVEAPQTQPALIHQPVDWSDPICIEDHNDLNIEAQLLLEHWNDPVNIEDGHNLEIAEECDTNIEDLRTAALEQTQESSYQFGNWDNPFCYIEDSNDLEIDDLWN